MECNLLSFRWRDVQFCLLEVTEQYGTLELTICRFDRFRCHASGEYVSRSWPLFAVCFHSPASSVRADIHVVGRLFTIRRKRRTSDDGLPF